MINRLKATLHSPNFLLRATHFAFGKVIFASPDWLRKRMFVGNAYQCPICQTNLRQFITLYRDHIHWCPICFSLQRHRMVWLFMHGEQVRMQQIPRRLWETIFFCVKP